MTAGAGGGETYVYRSAELVKLVPSSVVTVTSTVPADPAGAIAVIWPSESTVKLVADLPPKLTALALVNPLPAMVTVFPPSVGPWPGLIPDTVGNGGGDADSETTAVWIEDAEAVPAAFLAVTTDLTVCPTSPGPNM